MTGNALLQFLFFACATMALAMPCAAYLARVFGRQTMFADVLLGPAERFIDRIAGLQSARQQSWGQYAASMLIFNFLGGVALFVILLFQDRLPWNPQHFGALPPGVAFSIVASFITNTGWQARGGGTTLSYFSQTAGLTTQTYLSAATGLAVAFAVIRGFAHKESNNIGNFYADVARIMLYVLLPLALIFSLFLIWQGVPQNLGPYVHATTLEGAKQVIAQGPVASQVAIKTLGSNGGGFFNASAAHPYEDPTPLSNFLQTIGILLLPIALVLAFGLAVGDKRQGWALFVSMTILFLLLLTLCLCAENTAPPALAALNIDQNITDANPGGNMEGKEARFGIFDSVLRTVVATSSSNGSVNSALDSYMPSGGLVPLFNLLIGSVIYGGAGCGLYGILIYVLLTVFIAGLMIGRTPEYLGKKIEAREIKLVVLAMLVYPLCVLGFGVISLLSPEGIKSVTAAGPHGLTQTLYAYASVAVNNGSSFAGFDSDTPYQNIMMGIVTLIGRYGIILPVLAIAGSLAAKKTITTSGSVVSTHGATFALLLTCVIMIFGALAYFPVLALGPIAEHLSLFAS